VAPVPLPTNAPTTPLGIFLVAFAELPRARPVPIVLAGASRPAWAQPASATCARPYREGELLSAVRATLGLTAARPSAPEQVPLDALMLP
jgi:two-component system, sensor histidine kinase